MDELHLIPRIAGTVNVLYIVLLTSTENNYFSPCIGKFNKNP